MDGPSTRKKRNAGAGEGGESAALARIPAGADGGASPADPDAAGGVPPLDGAARNPSLGRIAWADKIGRLGVAWLDVEAFPLLATAAEADAAKNAAIGNAAGATLVGSRGVPPKEGDVTAAGKGRASSPASGATASSGGKTTRKAPPLPLMAVRGAGFAPLALVRAAHPRADGRALALVVVRGALREDAELFLPSPEMAASLERSLPLAPGAPAGAGGASFEGARPVAPAAPGDAPDSASAQRPLPPLRPAVPPVAAPPPGASVSRP
ncbi:MAG: hypothetical protein LBG65_01185 [Puniceicoccales bacterium]|nr:hypothetical protein [Puniceicoccales bacterium]